MLYRNETDTALHIATMMGELVRALREAHTEYPELTATVFHVLYGQMTKFKLDCPHCGRSFEVATKNPVGGIIDCCPEMNETLKMLELELLLEEVEEDGAPQEG